MLQRFVDEEGGPDNGFQNSKKARPEVRGVGDVVNDSSDEPQPVDRAGRCALMHVLCYFFPPLLNPNSASTAMVIGGKSLVYWVP